MEKFRSKSIGDVLEYRPEYGDDEDEVRERLERLRTHEDQGIGEGGAGGAAMKNMVSRHDQYHGLGRQPTSNQ